MDLGLLFSDGTISISLAATAINFIVLYGMYEALKKRMKSHDKLDREREEKLENQIHELDKRLIAEQARIEALNNDMTKVLTILEFVQKSMEEIKTYFKK